MNAELVLGTAQFGSAYGITNALGRLDDTTVREILRTARDGGIHTFDSAADYGDAQERLHSLGSDRDARYVSKFGLPEDPREPADERIFESSRLALGVASLHGVLFHRVDDLRDPRADVAWEILVGAREAGVIARIGVSVYDIDDLKVANARFPGLDIVQIPGNIVDDRMIGHPMVQDLHDGGVEVHVRSAFLQGLLLAGQSDLPRAFGALAPVLDEIDQRAASTGRSRMSLLLGHLKAHPAIDAVVVGATTPDELAAIQVAWNTAGDAVVEGLPPLPVELIDPRKWR